MAKVIIRLIRKRKDMSLLKLSEKSGIKKSNLSNIERNLKSPTLDELEKISSALGERITKLFFSIRK